MTLSTRIRILGDVSPEGVFATARQIIGIPQDQPLTIGPLMRGAESVPNRIRTSSQPGGFDSALDVDVAPQGPDGLTEWGYDPEEDEDTGPEWNISVHLDTSYHTPPGGEPCDAVHRRICTELGAWLEAQGADWYAEDEFTGEWHQRTPCPIR